MASLRHLGGFLPLRLGAGAAEGQSVLSRWVPRGARAWFLHNARSALHELWSKLAPPTIWLPAYICPEIVSAVPPTACLAFYSLDARLEPDARTLSRQVRKGDSVLAVDYFGRLPSHAFLELVQSREDVHWVEDRAQALTTSTEPWGNWVVYSPRKLLGVPDGGVLVANRFALWTPPLLRHSDLSFMMPLLERYEDVDEIDNERWYLHYREQESRMGVDRLPMSRLSREILGGIALDSDAALRHRNFQRLYDTLSAWAFMSPDNAGPAPMGFPICVNDATRLARDLAQRGVFAARHWTRLPSDRIIFETEHRLASRMLTLPCDYRFDARTIDQIAAIACESLRSSGE